MRSVRVIPCLDVDAGRVVKGVNFVNLRDAGDPVELAARYDAEGADEIVFLDITASSDARHTMVDVARRTAETVFIPFTVGGGIRAPDDARALLRAGADKVGVNTAAVDRPELIDRAGRRVRRPVRGRRHRRPPRSRRRWEVFTHGGRTPTGLDAVAWAEECERPGRRRDPAHVDGPRRHPRRLRPGADPRRVRRLPASRSSPAAASAPSTTWPRAPWPAGPTPSWPRRSSTSASTPSARPRTTCRSAGITVRPA